MPEVKTTPHSEPELLIHARWIAPVQPEALLENHAVAISSGRIIDILPSPLAREKYRPGETVNLDEYLLIPGLINMHAHAAMSLMRGMADDLPLMTWLREHIWPAEATHVSHQFVRDGTLLACAEMLKSGITCFNDMYFFPDAAAEAVHETGIRARLGITIMDLPSSYASDGEDYITKGMEVRDKWREHPLIQFALAPHAPYTVNDKTFDRIQTLSAQLELPIHLHIHETQQEIDDHIKAHECRPLTRLDNLGILGPQFIGVHAVHLDAQDFHLLSHNGCNIVHCPTSNLKLASGIAPTTRLNEQQINLTLGTDGAASNNRLDMLSEMRLASLLAKGSTHDASALPAYQTLRMATLNGAIALGLEKQLGSIETGKLADLCAIKMDSIETSPCFDPISHLVYCVGREQITHVWVNGKCCVFNKTLTQTSEASLKNVVRLWQNKLGSTQGSFRIRNSDCVLGSD